MEWLAVFNAAIDATARVGFPIVSALGLIYVVLLVARWFMRTGDELKDRAIKHVDDLDARQDEIKPQLDRIEKAVNERTCRAANGYSTRPHDFVPPIPGQLEPCPPPAEFPRLFRPEAGEYSPAVPR